MVITSRAEGEAPEAVGVRSLLTRDCVRRSGSSLRINHRARTVSLARAAQWLTSATADAGEGGERALGVRSGHASWAAAVAEEEPGVQ